MIRVKLMGVAEVAAHLDVSKQQVNNLHRAGHLPTPLQVLAAGPVWDAEAIREFADSWDRKRGPARIQDRYVEVTYRRPGDNQGRWAGYLTKARSPREALANVSAAVQVAHPDAGEIEEFLQRRITPQKAANIRARMEQGTWAGWDLGVEPPTEAVTGSG